MTFVTAQDPTKRAVEQYNKKTTPNLTTAKITTTTSQPQQQQQQQQTNNTTAKTPNDTELDHKLEDYKINHNNQCPEQQKVWSLDPSQANH